MIPASRYPHGYVSVRSLAQAGVYTIAAVADENLGITASRFSDEVILVPPPSDLLAYKHALLGIAARPDVRTIIPHRPQDPYILSKYYHEFDRYVDLAIPSLETLRNVHDRKILMDTAEEAGIPIPKTQLLNEVDDWDSDYIVKSRYNLLTDEYIDSFSSEDSSTENSVIHIPAGETPDITAIQEEMNHTPIVQEYVKSADQYVFGALYDHGEALATFQHRQIRGDSYTGGGGVYRESVNIPELDEVGQAILDSLDWHGLACIEYVEDANTGEFKLIEINPRMWQSLACAVRAGADFPYWYWLQVTGSSDLIESEYEVGIKTHYIYGELQHLLSVLRKDSPFVDQPSLPGTIREILISCYDTPAFDYFHVDDPLPILRQSQIEHRNFWKIISEIF